LRTDGRFVASTKAGTKALKWSDPGIRRADIAVLGALASIASTSLDRFCIQSRRSVGRQQSVRQVRIMQVGLLRA
jgi:hypothetical protein